MSSLWRNSLRLALLPVLAGALLAARAQEPATLGGFKLAEFPAAGAPPAFKLVSAGAEPRRALRYRLAAGVTHTLVMTMRMSIGVEVDGREAPVQRTPAIRMVLECRVREADERAMRLEFSAPQPPELLETEGVPPAMIEAMRKGLGPLSSMRGQVEATSRGVVTKARVEFGPGLDPGASQMLQSMQQSMEQASVPLPEEAVGAGARWKMLQRVQGSGITIYQVASFTLERIEGQIATLAVTVEQLGPRQDMQMPGGPGGARAELASMHGRGEGRSAVDLRSPVPRSSVDLDSTLRMNVQAQDRTVHMGMRNRMQLQMEPAAK